MLIVCQRLGVPFLHFEPRFNHRSLNIEQGFELRAEACFHGPFDRQADSKTDNGQEYNGNDGPNPELFFEKYSRARHRAADRRVRESHVCLAVGRRPP